MANRRCFQTLTRYFHSIKSPTPLSQILAPTSAHALRQTLTPKLSHHICENKFNLYSPSALFTRHFSSRDTDKDEDDNEDDESEEEEGESGAKTRELFYRLRIKNTRLLKSGTKSLVLSRNRSEFSNLMSLYLPLSSNGDSIYTERLKYCDVNDKLILNKVLMLGSKTQTVIGRPILPDAAVHAVVEEHALDAKVIIFKKKRRKNYRRTKGHRQELTKLRITDIQGIEKPEKITPVKTEKKEKLAVGA
ncbi:UNVERIFIED_CONTAM: 50S ribosomal protein L21, mitochondrial [Sesamum radiatum]|uniref:Large ribosomal subunit protein bL21m n=1 Tax=Sesamum radiatum TaxID=300843 RepID=A0AAW2KHZ0_SESRA